MLTPKPITPAAFNLTLDALSTRRTEQGNWGKDNYRHLTQQQDIGSQITGAGEVTLQAGQDLNATAAHVNAGQAGKQLTVGDATRPTSLVINNRQGTLIAGEHATINAHALSGDGQLLSQGDMAVTLTEDFHHTGNTASADREKIG